VTNTGREQEDVQLRVAKSMTPVETGCQNKIFSIYCATYVICAIALWSNFAGRQPSHSPNRASSHASLRRPNSQSLIYPIPHHLDTGLSALPTLLSCFSSCISKISPHFCTGLCFHAGPPFAMATAPIDADAAMETPDSSGIAGSAATCASIFNAFLTGDVDGGDAELSAWAEEQMARFSIWAANLGVFARGHASADYRLRDSDEVCSLILQ
jgi:hypothetical protein